MKQNSRKTPAFLSPLSRAEKDEVYGRYIDWVQDDVIAPLFIAWIQKRLDYLIADDEKAVEEAGSEFELSKRLVGNLNKRIVYKDILKVFDTGENV